MDDALDLIADLIDQHCWSGGTPAYNSRYLTVNAAAMRFLAEHGRFKILGDDGQYVYGEMIWPNDDWNHGELL